MADLYQTKTRGGWAAAEHGKWHRTVSDEPSFMRIEKSLCGLTFRPLNASWDGFPSYSRRDSAACGRCERIIAGQVLDTTEGS